MPASLKHLTDKKLHLSSLLAKWKDGLFYTAAVVKVDKNTKRCLVCFEDGSEIWLQNRDLHIQLSLDQLNEDDDIVCSICDDGASEPPNEIIICDICQQGYHQKCHIPPVDSSKIDESDTDDHKDWFCATCSYILNQSNRDFLTAKNNNNNNNDNNIKQKQQGQHASKNQSQTKAHPSKKSTTSQVSRTGNKVHDDGLSPGKSGLRTSALASEKVASVTKNAPSTNNGTLDSSQSINDQGSSKITPQHVHHQDFVSLHSGSAVAEHGLAIVSSPITLASKASSDSEFTEQSASSLSSKSKQTPSSGQARTISISPTSSARTYATLSALTVGGSAGRTKQDVVDQSNRQKKATSEGSTSSSPVTVKHAVRKSSVNFVIPPDKQQSALPIATRSIPGTPTVKLITTPAKQHQQQNQQPPTPNQYNNSASSSPRLVSPSSASSSTSSPSSSSISGACEQVKATTIVPIVTTNHRITVETHKSLMSPGAKTLTVVRPAPLSMAFPSTVIEKSTAVATKAVVNDQQQHQAQSNPIALSASTVLSVPEVKKLKKDDQSIN